MSDHLLRSQVQHLGQAVSRHLFTERVLARPLGKRVYLGLYRGFKFLFESRDLKQLGALIPPGSTVLDIGANVGVTAAFFRQAVGPEGRVLAFEPDPIMVDVFQFHLKQRGLDRIQLFPVALGAQDGVEQLFQNASNRADNRMVLDAEGMTHTKQIAVQVRSLSSLAQESPELFRNVRFIKIDVQGYEHPVLSGMSDWLQGLAQKPVIHMEVWPYGLKKAGSSAKELLALCTRLGYEVTADTLQQVQAIEQTDAYMDVTLTPTPVSV